MGLFDKGSKDEILDFEEGIEEFFDRFHSFVRHSRFSLEPVWRPPVDIVEVEDEVIIFAELPGVKKDEIEITYKGGVVKLRGVRHQPDLQNQKKFTRLEIEYGKFERLINVGEGIDSEKISVSLDDGILKIRLPYKEKKRVIKVEIEK